MCHAYNMAIIFKPSYLINIFAYFLFTFKIYTKQGYIAINCGLVNIEEGEKENIYHHHLRNIARKYKIYMTKQ
jgi:hypothetical protein